MRTGARMSGVALGAGAALVMLVGMGMPVAGQGQSAYKAPRLQGTQQPDLNGVYQALTTANWDILTHAAEPGPVPSLGAWFARPAGMSIVEGNEIPYQPWAVKKKQENFNSRLKADRDDQAVGDSELKCFMPGVPRATYMPYPFQILQGSSKYIMIAYEFANTSRVIHMEDLPSGGVDSWMGESRGKWDGDTLVVEVTGFNDMTWFDRAGNFHSDGMRVVERYTPTSPYHVMYEATIEDAKVFTRPWKIRLPLYRRIEPGARLMEFKCVEFTDELLYGRWRAQPSKSK
jgi:hypothetical protein